MMPRTGAELAARKQLEASALAGVGRLTEAIDHARAAASAQPSSAEPLVLLSVLCALAQRFDDAIGALEQASRMPGVEPGTFDERLGQLRAARTDLENNRLLEGDGARAPEP